MKVKSKENTWGTKVSIAVGRGGGEEGARSLLMRKGDVDSGRGESFLWAQGGKRGQKVDGRAREGGEEKRNRPDRGESPHFGERRTQGFMWRNCDEYVHPTFRE